MCWQSMRMTRHTSRRRFGSLQQRKNIGDATRINLREIDFFRFPNFQKLTFPDFGVPDLPDPWSAPGRPWTSLESSIHLGFSPTIAYSECLETSGTESSPRCRQHVGIFFYCSHDKTNGFPTQIREAGHVASRASKG